MKRTILFILVFIPYLLNAQKYGEILCLNDYEGQGVRVKLLYNSVYVPDGFDIYRTEKGKSDWVLLNSTPLKPVKTLPAANKLDQEAKDLFKGMIETPFDDWAKNPVRVFVMIKAVYVDELAEYMGILYKDQSAQTGTEYVYKFHVHGASDAVAESLPIKVAPYSKGAPIENPKFKRSKKRVDISWKPDLYRYYGVDIYKKKADESEFVKITKTPRAIQKDQAKDYSEKSVFFIDTNIVYTDNYVYKLVAIDYFGQQTEFTAEYSVPAEDFIPPTAPFNVIPTASSVNAYVRLDWKLVDENDLAGVNVYETSNPDLGYRKLNDQVIPKTQLTYTHTSVPVGGHYYKVMAVDLAGNENADGAVFVDIKDITAPEKPRGLTSEAGEGFITLKWSPNSEADLAGYMIQRTLKKQVDDGKSYINVNKDPIKETTYTEQLPKNVRNEFVYRIVAIDTNFNRSDPSENTLAKMPDVTPPLQPLIKNIIPDSSKLVVQWLQNADTDLDGYNVFRRIFKDSLSLEKVNFSLVPGTVSSYTDRTVKPGVSYEYFIEAVDKAGNKSAKSKSFFAKTGEQKIEGSIVVEDKKLNTKKGTLTVEWSATATQTFKGFVVFAKNSSGTFKPVTGMLTEKRAVISLDGKTDGEFYIKGYTEDGQFIQSKSFTLNEEN